MNLNDARAKRTRRAIRENFMTLLREKPVSRVTVKDICELCQINRSTFYKHYRDPLDVLEKLEGEVLDSLERSLPSAFDDVGTYLDGALAGIEAHGGDYMILASQNGDPALHAKIFQRCYQAVFPRFDRSHPELTPAQRDMAYQYLTQGSGGVLSAWIRSGMAEPRENVVKLLLDLNCLAASNLKKQGGDRDGA